MMLVNALGSGGDAVAAVIVLRQVPALAALCFHNGRAYWRPAKQLAEAEPAGNFLDGLAQLGSLHVHLAKVKSIEFQQ